MRLLIPISLVATLSPSAVLADDVSWLREVTTVPQLEKRDQRKLSPLLTTTNSKPITTLAAWKKRRQAIHKAWLKFLGPMPKRPAVKLKTLRTDRLKTVTRTLVEYESEPGLKVQGYLLKPNDLKPGEKRAGIVALHPTTRDTIEPIAGVKGPEEKQIGLKLAQRGFVVFCPRCFLWQDAKNYNEAVATFKKRHPKTLGMRKMLYDARRGVDVLESLSYVDAKRIGAVGHSLGAKETLYLMAFDDRIKAGVASEGGLAFDSTNWDAPWYLGKAIHKKGFPRNHHELLALIAPRPFLVLGGEKGRGAADGNRSWPFLASAQPVCKLYGQPPRLALYNHGRGHAIPPKAMSRLVEWLEVYLEHRSRARPRRRKR